MSGSITTKIINVQEISSKDTDLIIKKDDAVHIKFDENGMFFFKQTEGINHQDLMNIGNYTHDQIDDHLNSMENPHHVTKEQIGLGNVQNLKNYTGQTNPGKYDDETKGYQVGSRFYNTDTCQEYVALSVNQSDAVWKETTNEPLQPHIHDESIHFTQDEIEHQKLIGSGQYSHLQIDIHLDDDRVHFLQEQIEHSRLIGSGHHSHEKIDQHLDDTNIHFQIQEIDHNLISNSGAYTHQSIDQHIENSSIHFTKGDIDHQEIRNSGTFTHSQIDQHLFSTNDDHPQYIYRLGRPSGQTIIGGTYSGDKLILQSTSHSQKGFVQISEVTESTSPETGAFQVAGGAGIKKSVHVGQKIYVPEITSSGNLQLLPQGELLAKEDPISDLGVATKQYVDNQAQDLDEVNNIINNLRGATGGLASLGPNGKVPISELPELAKSQVYTVNSLTERDALTVQMGDIAKVLDKGDGFPGTYIYDGSNWIDIESSSVYSVNGYLGTINLTTSDIPEGSNLYYTEQRVSNNTDVLNSASHIVNYNNPHLVTKGQIGLPYIWNIKSNYTSNVAPTFTDDTHLGYSVGSRWFDINNSREYVCLDPTLNAAIWRETTVTYHTELFNSGNKTHAQIDAHINDDGMHRRIDDISTSTIKLWSSDKIQTELDTKSDIGHLHSSNHITDIDSKIDGRIGLQKGSNNGLATLDGTGKVPQNQLPAISITNVHVVNTISERDDLVTNNQVQTGDTCKVIGSGLGYPKTFIYDGTQWVEINTTSDVLSVNSYVGEIVLDIDDVTPTTNKGDLIVENGSNAVKLPVGQDCQILTADSTTSTGIRWANRYDNFGFIGKTDQGTYHKIYQLIFPGTNNVGEIKGLKVIGYLDQGLTSYDIRVRDYLNKNTVAIITSQTNTEPQIIDLGTILYQPTNYTILEIQAKINGVLIEDKFCCIESLLIKY